VTPDVKANFVDFLKALGYTDEKLRQMTDDQLACVVFEETGKLLKP